MFPCSFCHMCSGKSLIRSFAHFFTRLFAFWGCVPGFCTCFSRDSLVRSCRLALLLVVASAVQGFLAPCTSFCQVRGWVKGVPEPQHPPRQGSTVGWCQPSQPAWRGSGQCVWWRSCRSRVLGRGRCQGGPTEAQEDIGKMGCTCLSSRPQAPRRPQQSGSASRGRLPLSLSRPHPAPGVTAVAPLTFGSGEFFVVVRAVLCAAGC